LAAAPCLAVAACCVRSDSAVERADLVGAAYRLTATKTVELDNRLIKNGLVASVSYMNLSAFPRRLGEKGAFAAVLVEQDRLGNGQPPAGIVRDALPPALLFSSEG